jgi:hypothetical protein
LGWKLDGDLVFPFPRDTTWWPPSFLAPKGHNLFFYKFIICVCVCVLQPNGHLFSPSQGTPLGGHQLYSTQVTQPFFFHSLCFLFLTTKWPPSSPWDKNWAIWFSSLPKKLFFPPKQFKHWNRVIARIFPSQG